MVLLVCRTDPDFLLDKRCPISGLQYIDETLLSKLQSGSSGPDHDPDFDPEVTVADPTAATRRKTRAGATTRARAGSKNKSKKKN